MVDDKDNQVVSQDEPGSGWHLALALLGAFRSLIDEAHALLAQRGHPGVRPAFGFALQAVGPGATASQIGERLGVSKQAAAKTISLLESAGYVQRFGDASDGRRKLVRPTALGRELLHESAKAFDEIVALWAERTTGADISHVQDTLARLGLATPARLDLGTWSS